MNTVFKGEFIFVRILVPVVIGITVGLWYHPSHIFFKFSLAIAILLLIGFFILIRYYRKFRLFYKKWIPGLIAQLLIVSIFYAITISGNQLLIPRHFSKSKQEALVVSISSEPKRTKDILRFEADVLQELKGNQFYPVMGKLLIALKIEEGNSDLSYGDELLVPATYAEVDPPFNPYEFDFRSYLASHNIYQQAFISGEQVQHLARDKGNKLIAYSLAVRQEMIGNFAKYVNDKDALAVASTLILGYRASLSPEIVEAFSKTGTMHVLSVSGMHVALVLVILSNLLWFMKKHHRLRIVRAILIISLIWIYALITGFSPSVCRAALMISVLTLGNALNRRINTYNLLSASAVLLLVYNPRFIIDVGFQLSYLAVLGLVYFHPKIYHFFYIRNWLLDKVWSYTALSLAAQLATFPLAMYYFNQFPVYFLLSNLLIVLPVELIMYSGLLFLLLFELSQRLSVSIEPLLQFTAKVLEFTITSVESSLIYIQHLPYASIAGSHHNILHYVLMLILVFVVSWAILSKAKVLFYLSLALVFILTLNISIASILNETNRKLIFYSLRKNYAFAYIQNGKAGLFSDLKPEDKTYSYSLKPSLDGWTKSVDSSFSGNFKVFAGYRVLVWDPSFNRLKFKKTIKVDAVLLNNNPGVTMADLSHWVKADIILIAGTNKDHRIQKWLKEAEILKLRCYVLKKNPAYIINLKS